jgi:histidine triad (HIT) family protein
MSECVFCRIAANKQQADIIFEDKDCLAFEDTNPQAPVHFLVIPRTHIETLLDAEPEMLGKLMRKSADLAGQKGIDKSGFRAVINCGRNAGQTVYHLHVHVMGGRWFAWPPG